MSKQADIEDILLRTMTKRQAKYPATYFGLDIKRAARTAAGEINAMNLTDNQIMNAVEKLIVQIEVQNTSMPKDVLLNGGGHA